MKIQQRETEAELMVQDCSAKRELACRLYFALHIINYSEPRALSPLRRSGRLQHRSRSRRHSRPRSCGRSRS